MRSNPYEENSPRNWVLRAEHMDNLRELARATPRAEIPNTSSVGSRLSLRKSASAPFKSNLGPGDRDRSGCFAGRSESPTL